MHILYCNDPFVPGSVDSDFVEERDAAAAAGLPVLLFSFESLVREQDAQLAIRKIQVAVDLQAVIYRGWMLKPHAYQQLYDALLAKNYQLINTPQAYRHCHYLPDSYAAIAAYTPKTSWQPGSSFSTEAISTLLQPFGNSPLIIKDYVKSQKHYWDTACFIPDASDTDKAKSVIDTFLALQGDDLNEGIVIRQFVPLHELAIHPVSGMPLTQEYRLFFKHQQLIACYEYWDEGVYTAEPIPLHYFTDIASKISSSFFSMDVARQQNGEWTIIELGDGQVAGLPDHADKNKFYQQLAR